MDLKPFDNLTEFNKDNAKVLLNLSFSVSDWSKHNSDDTTLPKINDFNLISTLKTHDTYGLKNRKFCAIYHSEKLNILIVCFSGTEFLSEWLDDFDIRQTKSEFIPEEYKILLHIQHYNFYNTLREELLECIKEYINDDTVLVCTGHSLGGSVASICFVDMIINNIIKKRTIYTFAASRTGNTEFANMVDKENTAFRIANTEDLVPTLPPAVVDKLIYTHYKGIYFTKNMEDLSKNHGDSYTYFFE